MPMAPPPKLKAGMFARTPVSLGPKPIGEAKLPPAKPPPGVRIEHRVGIQAPAEVIWEILSDIDHWGDWSVLYPRATGQVKIGAPVSATLALPGEEPREINPQIIEWVPYEQIIWGDIQWRGWSRSTRYFEIEEMAKTACAFSTGELFDGFISKRYGNKYRRAMKKGFAAMGEALKVRAEAEWQSRQGQTK